MEVNWRKSDVDSIKKSVKTLIDSECENQNPTQKLKYILRMISELSNKENSLDLLQQLIFIISALVHHTRFGGLQPNLITKLETLAHDILRFAGVKPTSSKLAFLYGELHVVLSQIDRMRGQHWESLWQQQLAVYYSGPNSIGGEGFTALSLGIRLFRLGLISQAIKNFKIAANDPNLSEQRKIHAGINIVRCLRLTGQYEESQKFSLQLKEKFDLPETYFNELTWEEYCRSIQKGDDLKVMQRATKKNQVFFAPGYILEMFLWVFAAADKKYIQKLPSPEYLIKKVGLKLKKQGILFDAADVLKSCYDFEIPYQVRFRQINTIIQRKAEFTNLEHQLLFMIGCARFLLRSRAYDMAHIIVVDYTRMVMFNSANISDPLGIAQDLVKRFIHGEEV